MKVPYKVEHINDLRARFPKALEPVIDLNLPDHPVPGDLPEHVFDCVDGIRVIASRDNLEQKSKTYAVYFHFSASAIPGTVLYAKIREGRIDLLRFKKICEERFNDLTGLTIRPADHFNITAKKIPHWFWKEQYTNESGEVNADQNLS